MMSIQKDITELVKANVFSQETASKILDYYKKKESNLSNRLFVVFGVLGAILVGLGIILIIAHNWDELSRLTKIIFAFIPLVISQLFSAYTLLKKKNDTSWVEGSTVFLFFTIGASISLVSQIYHIDGELSSFLLIWMLLILPMIYIMKSSITSLLYIAGITYYSVEIGYSQNNYSEFNYYWILFLLIIPYFYFLYINKAKSNFMIFHNWLLPISLTISLGTISQQNDQFMFLAYINLFAFFYLLGSSSFFSKEKTLNNPYKVFGSIGTVGILFALSFDWFWNDLKGEILLINSPEFIVSVLLFLIALIILFFQLKGKSLKNIKPIQLVFIAFALVFLLGIWYSISVILINVIIFAIGLLTIYEGSKLNRFGILNYGLLIITALVICRFFDTELSFIFRGLLFVFVGSGFFLANYFLMKKIKKL